MSCITHIIKQGDTLYNLAKQNNTTVQNILNYNPHIIPYSPYNLPVGATLTICNQDNNCMSIPNVNLLTTLNNLWEQHVHWTYATLVSIAENLRDLEPVKKRLLQNAVDMGNFYRHYYGDAVGNKIAQLFNAHLTIAGDLIVALKNGYGNQAKMLNEKWYKNADDIAEYMKSINPIYDLDTLKNMLHTHLDLLTAQIKARLKRDYTAQIKAYDEGAKEAIRMSEYFAQGIMKQKK